MMYVDPNASHGAGSRNVGLEEYLKAIKRHRILILAVVLAFGVLGWWFASSRVATYQAQARIMVGPSPVGTTGDQLRPPILEREREVLSSTQIASAVIDRLDLDEEPAQLLSAVNVEFVPDSEVMRVNVVRRDPQEAARIANAFAGIYVERREDAADGVYRERLELLDERVADLQGEIDSVRAEIDALAAERAAVAAVADSPTQLAQVQVYDSQITALRDQLYNLNTAQLEAQRSASAVRVELEARQSTAGVLRSAVPPTVPGGPGATTILAVALIVGLAAGVVAALVRDRLDTTARDESRISLALGAQVLTSVPVLPWSARSGSQAMVMLSGNQSAAILRARESYRRLRSAMSFLASSAPGDNGAFAITVTSALPAEGKSVTSANLAVAIAHSGSRVALVNADLRAPTLEELFGVGPGDAGLATYLAQETDLEAVPAPGVDNLWLVPAGPKPQNPAELLGSDQFSLLLKNLREEMDYVIVDSPPVLTATDPSIVARVTDGVVVVVDSRTTDTTELLQLRADLDRTGASIIGAVLNRDRRPSSTRRRLRSRYGS